jgi:hypothetical protein
VVLYALSDEDFVDFAFLGGEDLLEPRDERGVSARVAASVNHDSALASAHDEAVGALEAARRKYVLIARAERSNICS